MIFFFIKNLKEIIFVGEKNLISILSDIHVGLN